MSLTSLLSSELVTRCKGALAVPYSTINKVSLVLIAHLFCHLRLVHRIIRPLALITLGVNSDEDEAGTQ